MKKFIKTKIEELLSQEYCCCLEEINGKDTIYTINANVEQDIYVCLH